jgi:hypothetical protein
MFKALKCRLAGHVFVDSRKEARVQVCVRCRHRKPFQSMNATRAAPPERDEPPVSARTGHPGDPTAP